MQTPAVMTAPLAIYIATLDDALRAPDVLSADEHARLQAMGSARRRRQFSAGRRLLRHALSHHSAATPADAWPLVLHDARPVLATDDGLCFSLSHSGDHLACIIGRDTPCGIDVQARRDGTAAIAREFFDAHANTWLRRQPDPDHAFHQLWVLKEAWAKATGTPLLTALKDSTWAVGHAASHEAGAWAAGTATLPGALTLGWTASDAPQAPPLWAWRDGRFVATELAWTRWRPAGPACTA